MIFNTPQIHLGNTKNKRKRPQGLPSSTPVAVNGSNLIVELGQSNMSGQSGDINNPDFPFPNTNGVYWTGTEEVQLISTRGSAGEGSHATYFADKYFELFGAKPIMVERAASATDMIDWGAGSGLRSGAKTKTDSALAHYGVANPKAVLWCQGESDAKYFSSLYASKQEAKAALQSIVDWWFTNYPDSLFLISELGNYEGYSYLADANILREVQNEICNENPRVIMAFTGAKDFVADGKMKDYVHYNYIGLKEMGEAFAIKLHELSTL